MNDKNRLKQSIKVSEVISAEWWSMKRQFENQYIMRCISPTHEDKKPSMVINDEKQIFTCFSCGIWWDIFNVLDYMRPDINWFYQQLRHLENSTWYEVIDNSFSLRGEEEIITDYQDDKEFQKVMNYIADYWSSELPKKIEDTYILNSETISYKAFKWWYETSQWYWLSRDIIKEHKLWYSEYNSKLYKELLTKFDKTDIDKTKLFDKRWISLFKGRITIPTIVKGDVKYFTSRKTEYSPLNKYEEAKYKNQKIDNIYYYNEDDLDSDCVFITEWYFDCLALKNIWYNSISLWGLFVKYEKRLIEW